MKGKFLLLVLLVMVLLMGVPVGAQAEATPEPEYMTYEQVVDLLVRGPSIAGTIYDSPVVDENLLPDIRPQDEVLAMVDQMIADAQIGAVQAQVIEDMPPIVIDDDARFQLFVLALVVMLVVFGGGIAYL